MSRRVEIVLSPEEAAEPDAVHRECMRAAGIEKEDIAHIRIRKKSIDARSRRVVYRFQTEIFLKGDPLPVPPEPRTYKNVKSALPVLIIGTGPAGLFAALRLLEFGLKPVLIERGKDVRERRRDLASLNKQRIVNPNSNYCFGEGGAGTYSDGKLYTRADKRGDIAGVLRTFVDFGADPVISVDAHPHIGTNKLPAIISSIRQTILDCGGEIHFNTRFTGLIHNSDGIQGIRARKSGSESGEITYHSKAIILATGHSATDIFEYFNNQGFQIQAKPFALGVRIEHAQEFIDKVQYKCATDRGPFLPPAPYTLSAHHAGKAIYSFCMCPGGIIAPATTHEGFLVVNGWSPSKRNNPFANSGLVVSVDDSDFESFKSAGALKALRYQQSVEQKAWIAGGSNLSAPAQRASDFLNKQSSSTLPPCSYVPEVTASNLHEVLPSPVAAALRGALVEFGKKMKGYSGEEAILVATESRTSSPVRIPRDPVTGQHPDLPGLFPCGEGAGFAGGIMSAAIDGERIAALAAVHLGVKM